MEISPGTRTSGGAVSVDYFKTEVWDEDGDRETVRISNLVISNLEIGLADLPIENSSEEMHENRMLNKSYTLPPLNPKPFCATEVMYTKRKSHQCIRKFTE